MAEVKKPSGLKLARGRNKFGCSWKRGADYTKQWFQKKINKKGKSSKWVSDSIGKSATSKIITLSGSDYFPDTKTILESVSFRVKGKKSKTTGWASKTLNIKPPLKPVVGYSQVSAYSTTFYVEANQFLNDKGYWGTYIEYQSVLAINKNYNNSEEVEDWGDITQKKIYDNILNQDTTSFSELYTETSEDITRITEAVAKNQSAVRWFRGRVSGPGGPSKWVGTRISYSESKPTYDLYSTIIDNGRSGYTCTVEWKYVHSINYPVDSMSIEYAFAIPDKKLKPIDPNPQSAIIGGSNTIVPEVKQTKESIFQNKVSFEIPGQTYPDQLVYVRVNVEHNGIPTYGDWVYCRDTSGAIPNAESMLSKPSISAVTPVVGQDKLTVVASNNSQVPGVFLVIRFIGDAGADFTKDIAVINTYDQTGEFSKVVEIPDYEGSYQIGVYAAVDSGLRDYYTVTGTAVADPVVDDIGSYYEKDSNNVYHITRDFIFKEYYTVTATAVSSPKVSFLDTYYELVNGIYVETEDESIVSGKTYYTLAATKVESPDISDIGDYYEYDHGVYHDDDDEPVARMYVHTEDEVLYGKTYYTLTGTIVSAPDAQYLGTYYNRINDIYYLTTDTVLYGTNAERISTGENIGYDSYTISAVMKSVLETFGSAVIKPPAYDDITIEHIGDGNIKISWNWNWSNIDAAEIAWSDYKDALYSTEPPDTYTVSSEQGNFLIIKGLSLGITWYFWVRLIKDSTVTMWSDVRTISLSSEPNIPVLTLSKNYITLGEKFSANWSYITTDDTEQASAKICLCTIDNDGKITYGEPIATIDGATQYYVFDTTPIESETGETGIWQTGNSYNLAVKVTSSSGLESESWSEYKTVTLVEPITCSISQSGLLPAAADYDPTHAYSAGDYAIKVVSDPDDSSIDTRVLMKCVTGSESGEEWDESHWMEDENYPYQEIHELSEDNPLTLTIAASTSDITYASVIIMRAQDYFVDRPDEGTYGGYAGEVIYQDTMTSLGEVTIELEDIYGNLDDDAQYYLAVSVMDNHEQTATATYPFTVKWTHQAVMPQATVTITDIAKIDISAPTGSIEGDYCDIYRMSSDGIDLIYTGAEFGSSYVDPYPTIGDQGGYRIVYRTYNGDYIAADGEFAWVDFLPEDGYIFNSVSNLIDFGSDTLEVKYNVDMSNSWKKDFKSTKYLGGSLQGDYNRGVERTSSLSSDIQTSDAETIGLIKDLATYEGLCHVRTKDGSNYQANVEVSESIPYQAYYDPDGKTTNLGSYSFSITRVDSQELDGMTYSDWLDDQTEGE